MAVKFFLLVSLFCSLSVSYDNRLQLWKDCPLTQSIRGSNGSLFEITIQKFENECEKLLSRSEIEEVTELSPDEINDLDIQLTIHMERANITWNAEYKNRCDRNIYMLDVEYRIKMSEENAVSTSKWCFQFNVSKVENKHNKENVKLYFDCIRTVPDKEAYLVEIQLWSLQQNWPLSSRRRRSVRSHCGRIQCTRSIKETLSIGPIQPIKDKVNNRERCQCWDNSSIRLQNTNTKNRTLLIFVDNPNPYAKFITANVHRNGNSIFRKYTMSPLEKTILTDISCDKDEGTYTPVLGYECDDQDSSANSQCQLPDVEGSSITCGPDPVKTHVPPAVEIPHITIVISVLAFIFVAVAVTVIVFVCKHKAFRKSLKRKAGLNNRFSSDVTSDENHGEEMEMKLLDMPNCSSRSRQIMFLDHTDPSKTPLRKDCVNLISEILQAVGIEILGLDRSQLFSNWIEMAERASKDDITEFLIIISRELVSCQNSYMKQQSNNEAISTESLNSTDIFSGAVLAILRHRYILPQRMPFRIHILCLEHSDSQLCEKYLDTYSSFMVRKGDRKNTFLYNFAKCVQHTNCFIYDENVMPRLLGGLTGTTALPENTEIYASTLQEKCSELILKTQPQPL
ncbi:hypothetical protein ACJMK2_015755 [Sinanodonta woodiana]|uniref:SEFIR domain-containing protein n=1 Tax=Sinanodonta woodiana TaxID=1069815 RepID=A0ABD3UV26_SINWO